MSVRRLYVEKRQGFDIPAQKLFADLKELFAIEGIEQVRVIRRYDIEGLTDAEYAQTKPVVFYEPPVDVIYEEELPEIANARVFAVEALPGQFDQTADSAAQCVQLVTQKERPVIRSAKVIALIGNIDDEIFAKIKNYCINAVESREASFEKPETLAMVMEEPADVKILTGFISMNDSQLIALRNEMGLAMSEEDLKFCQEYFAKEEKRDPSITEIRVIDTYWSDHCRHTTFTTAIDNVDIEEGKYKETIKNAYQLYLNDREALGRTHKDVTLMDIAVMGMRKLREEGKLQDLDVSEEINACSIVVKANIDGKQEDWLVMFKNETHNHPTEIEPFGGAATCLGGAIRDPLSGRSYVYQAMRVTGSADPRRSLEETIKGKLPQRKITRGAAHGYSSYGNQIGLATGQVHEIYHEGYAAKRLEIGAVVAAAPKENVLRFEPQPGDVVILVGGRTGRDGIGGATGSSKEHTLESLTQCGAEVQKGNPPTERKLQRLFRNPEVSRLIKRCNDFGAGGVAVAIGELTDGLVIELDKVKKKYDGLDGTELAISESQERMAVVVDAKDADKFIAESAKENLEATLVATVTKEPRLVMNWRGNDIVSIKRSFLQTNGVKQHTDAVVKMPEGETYFEQAKQVEGSVKDAWLNTLKDLNVCSQKGLSEQFDSTIGANTVLMPFGGKRQMTPAEGMVATLPLLEGSTNTATAMTFGFNPYLMSWSPFHGAVYSIVEAITKIVAIGGDYAKVRLTLQEYFESLGKDSEKWGKPFAALLGALWAQHKFGTAAIGGKDSMSGTFMDMTVPPSLIAFALDMVEADKVVSPEFKQAGHKVIVVKATRDEFEMPVIDTLTANFNKVYELIHVGKIASAKTVGVGGIASAISKMTLGEQLGFAFADGFDTKELFACDYGTIILELNEDVDLNEFVGAYELGSVIADKAIICGDVKISLNEIETAYTQPLEQIFPTHVRKSIGETKQSELYTATSIAKALTSFAKPRIFIPVFPGTNCEYDTAKAFNRAGGQAETLVIKNLTPSMVEESVEAIVKGIEKSQIIMLPGGFSGGDEPDGSGKFIAAMFRNPRITEAVRDLLKNRDGLMLGICNGFQALIKLGLVPFGDIQELTPENPTLTYNEIGRHVSCMVETKVVSNLSPWFNNVKVGDIHTIAVSHGEGRFCASPEVLAQLKANGQIATQYVNANGDTSMDIEVNPNGSVWAIEGITSPDGRILGKMGHSERIGKYVAKNVPGAKDQKLFEAGVAYFK